MVWIYIIALLKKLEIGAIKRQGPHLIYAPMKFNLLHLHEILKCFAINEARTCGFFFLLLFFVCCFLCLVKEAFFFFSSSGKSMLH